MKKILILATTFLFAIGSFAQDTTAVPVDTATLIQPVQLKSKHHFYLIRLMTGMATDIRKANYVGQVAKLSSATKDTAQLITVNVPAGLIVDLYTQMGTQPERLTSVNNNDIKKALQPQLMASAVGIWILKQIGGIDGQNASLVEQVIDEGWQIVKQFKQ